MTHEPTPNPAQEQAIESLGNEYGDDNDSFTGRRVNAVLARVRELEAAQERLRAEFDRQLGTAGGAEGDTQ